MSKGKCKQRRNTMKFLHHLTKFWMALMNLTAKHLRLIHETFFT